MLRYRKWIKRIVILLFWLLVWEGMALAIANAIVIASPIQVLEYLMQNGRERELWLSIGFSLERILAGFMLAFLLGIVMAVVNHRVSLLREFTEPLLSVIKAVPVAAVTVLLLLWFPSRYLSVILCFIIVLPNVYEQMMTGLKNIDKEQLALANCYGMSSWQKFMVIYRNGVVPYLSSSMKICVGLSFKSAVAAEIIATPVRTMGERLYFAKIHLDTPGIFAWTFIIVILSVVTEKILLFFFDEIVVKPAYDGMKSGRRKGAQENSIVEEISFDKIGKSYGNHLVIRSLNATINEGECYVIMGKSGSGKTTLLNLLTGIVQPDSGTVRLKLSHVQSEKRAQDVTFGMVFQNEVVLNSYDVIKNIEILAGHKLTQEEKTDLEILLPKECLKKKCRTLSGGMKRRVQIARAIFSSSSILVMDEPFRGLDEANRRICIQMIKKYRKNRILVIASHDERDAEDLGGIKWKLESH